MTLYEDDGASGVASEIITLNREAAAGAEAAGRAWVVLERCELDVPPQPAIMSPARPAISSGRLMLTGTEAESERVVKIRREGRARDS